MRRSFLVLGFLLLMVPGVSDADMIIGGETVFSARKGDCLSLIGAKFGVDWQLVAKENGLNPKGICRTGQQVTIKNRRIVPKVIPDGVIVNIPDRMLYFFGEGKLVMAFPVGLGLPAKEWQTPIGPFLIVRKERNPTWFVPKSIQREMERKGQPIETIVPPGPDNPLGGYALHTSLPSVLIHETIWPTTVYQWRSHGCIRVSTEHMEEFFSEIEKGAQGEIIYEPVNIAVRDGSVLLQVSRDVYRKIPSMDGAVKARIEERGLTDEVDWVKVGKVIKEKTGIAEDVTR